MVIWQDRRFLTFVSMIIVTVVGFWSKFYTGPVHQWLNNSLGGALYEIFWCLFFFGFFPRKNAIAPISIGVLVVTSALEALQLWKTPILDAMRATVVGRLLLGTTFVWSDFFYYAIGCLIGWLWLLQIWRWSPKN
jgi:Protein of unknown function (DUF2809)